MFLRFLFALLLIGGMVYGMSWFVWWIRRGEDTHKLSFKHFYSFYNIAPNKWNLCEDYVYLNVEEQSFSEMYEFYSFFDCLRYKHFKRKVEKNEKQQMAIRSQQKLIDEMKKIITEEEKKNQQWTQDKLRLNHEWRQNKLKSNSDY